MDIPTPKNLVAALNTLEAKKSDEIKASNDKRYSKKRPPQKKSHVKVEKSPTGTSGKKPVKKLHDHLHDRPFGAHEGLQQLQRELSMKDHPSSSKGRKD